MLTSLLIALGLNFDTLSVALVNGARLKGKHTLVISLKIGLCFGFGQAFMALIGALFGLGFKIIISDFDHWVAFILLGYIGVKMLLEADEKERCYMKHRFDYISLLPLIIATSIDALVIGISLVFIDTPIYYNIIIIGLVTLAVSFFGTMWGNILQNIFKNKIKAIGGFILIAIGFKILIEHIFFS